MTAERRAHDETGRLMRAIAALSAAPEPVSAVGRRLTGETAGSRDLLDALLTEVNETVLRRHLTFAGQDSNVLKLDVNDRRISQVLELEGSGASLYANFVGRSLRPEDARELLNLLCDYCAAAGHLGLLSSLPEDHASNAYGGVSWSELMALHERQEQEAASQKDIVAAMEITKQYAVALLRMEQGDRVFRWGDDMRCDALERLFPHLQDPTAAPDMRLWADGLRDNLALLAGRNADLLVLALVPRPNAAICLAHWHDVMIDVER